MSIPAVPADRTAELAAEVEHLYELLCDQGDELAQLTREHAELLRRLRIAGAKAETPYDRAAANTRSRRQRMEAIGMRVVR